MHTHANSNARFCTVQDCNAHVTRLSRFSPPQDQWPSPNVTDDICIKYDMFKHTCVYLYMMFTFNVIRMGMIDIYIHECINTYMCAFVYKNVYKYVHIPFTHTYLLTYLCKYTYVYIVIYTYISLHINIFICKYLNIYMNIGCRFHIKIQQDMYIYICMCTYTYIY